MSLSELESATSDSLSLFVTCAGTTVLQIHVAINMNGDDRIVCSFVCLFVCFLVFHFPYFLRVLRYAD